MHSAEVIRLVAGMALPLLVAALAPAGSLLILVAGTALVFDAQAEPGALRVVAG